MDTVPTIHAEVLTAGVEEEVLPAEVSAAESVAVAKGHISLSRSLDLTDPPVKSGRK